MKAISLKAAPGAVIPKDLADAVKAHSIHIAVSSAAVAFFATLFDADFMAAFSSFAALGAVFTSDMKGGTK